MTLTTIVEHGPNADILATGVGILKKGPPGVFSDCTVRTPAAVSGTRYPRSLPSREGCSSVTLSAHDPDNDGKHMHVILRFDPQTTQGDWALTVAAVIGALEAAGARFNDTPTPSKP